MPPSEQSQDVDSEKALFPEKPQETYAWWAYPVYDTEEALEREVDVAQPCKSI